MSRVSGDGRAAHCIKSGPFSDVGTDWARGAQERTMSCMWYQARLVHSTRRTGALGPSLPPRHAYAREE